MIWVFIFRVCDHFLQFVIIHCFLLSVNREMGSFLMNRDLGILFFVTRDQTPPLYRLLVLMLNQLSTILLVKMLQWHHAEQLLFIVINLLYYNANVLIHILLLKRTHLSADTFKSHGFCVRISICRRIPLILFFPFNLFFYQISHIFFMKT